jgi:hypothetical protein
MRERQDKNRLRSANRNFHSRHPRDGGKLHSFNFLSEATIRGIDPIFVQGQPLWIGDQYVSGDRAVLRDLGARDLEDQAWSYEVDNGVTSIERIIKGRPFRVGLMRRLGADGKKHPHG